MGVRTLNPDNLLLKFDVQATGRDRVFFTGGRFFDHAPSSPGPYSPSTEGLSERTVPGKTGILGWNHIFSPTTLLDFRFSDSWAQGIFTSPTVDPQRGGKDVVAELGIDPVNRGLPFHALTPGVPTVSITGFTGTAGWEGMLIGQLSDAYAQAQRTAAGFAAFSNHCRLNPVSPSVMEALKNELKDFDTSKGAIRFPVDKPLPAALVKKLVKARIAENEQKKHPRSGAFETR